MARREVGGRQVVPGVRAALVDRCRSLDRAFCLGPFGEPCSWCSLIADLEAGEPVAVSGGQALGGDCGPAADAGGRVRSPDARRPSIPSRRAGHARGGVTGEAAAGPVVLYRGTTPAAEATHVPVVVTVTLEPMRRRAHAGGTMALILLAAGLTGCSAGTSVAPQPASASGTVAVREGTAPPGPVQPGSGQRDWRRRPVRVAAAIGCCRLSAWQPRGQGPCPKDRIQPRAIRSSLG